MDVDWDKYIKLEELGFFRLITMRYEGRLVGYIVAGISQGLHYRRLKFATIDSIYVAPSHRCGLVAYRALKYAEQYYKELGVDVIQVTVKPHLPFDNLCIHLGYFESETIYTKKVR